jgi:hypothetical protein
MYRFLRISIVRPAHTTAKSAAHESSRTPLAGAAASPAGSCQRQLVAVSGPYPWGRAGSRRHQVRVIVVLTSRTTTVPFTRVRYGPSGQPRTTRQRPRPAPFPAFAGDGPARSGFGSRGRVAEAVIGLAVPGRPIRSLVAEDRSAAGVRDRTGPEPDAHELDHETIREPARQGVLPGTGGQGSSCSSTPLWTYDYATRRVWRG